MSRVKAAAYARTSTLLRQDPENQLVPIRAAAANRDLVIVDEYVDKVSGTTERRPELDRLLRDARMGKFKVVVVSALDRIARNSLFFLKLAEQLESYGVCLVSLREGVDMSSAVGRAVTQILSSVSELERNLISERIRVALAVKKATSGQTGWRCGRTPLSQALIEKAQAMRATGKSIREIARELKISKSSVERAVRKKS